ncbi:MAG: 3-methyl-2-oxobutanoate hydroxymethyltransferase [Anaerolineales bacterium]|nr:3-methyl-2-oxobutanoate hydroxymethyltransferase [Anaerolineales bacterium]
MKKVTPSSLKGKKRRGEKITLLTAYDFAMAKFINQAGVDIILVSDAVGTVGLGRSEAVSVSMDEMIYHTQAVRNGAGDSMVVTTLPFGSYETEKQAVENAVRLMKEGKADGVHLEGTREDAGKAAAIVESGIPLIAHVGITKKNIVRSGAIRIQGKTARGASGILKDVIAFAESGACAIILECIPMQLGEVISKSLEIPTISIGAGPYCDGQALVTQDMLGLFKELSPRFLKVYLDLSDIIVTALTQFREEVENDVFPTKENSYTIDDQELEKLVTEMANLLGR